MTDTRKSSFLGWALRGGAFFLDVPGSNAGGIGATAFLGSIFAYLVIFAHNVTGQLFSIVAFAAGVGLMVYGYNGYAALFESTDSAKGGSGALQRYKTDEVMQRAKQEPWRKPLHIAVELGYDDVAAVLLSYNSTVDAKDRDGNTALHLAADSERAVLTKVLLDNKASVNLRDKNGETPLFRAIRGGNRMIVQLLIDAAADVNAINAEGSTPLHLAAQGGRKDIVALLLSRNANTGVRNERNQTPLDLADKRRKDLVDLLRR